MGLMRNPFDKKKYTNCHEGHKYAQDIVSGKIRANKWITASCNRYFNDLKRSKEDKDCPFYFRPEKAEKFLRIVQKFNHAVGHWENPCIIYEPWQKFVWMNIKGFYSSKTKMIRFRTAHVDIARGNAKALCLETEIPTPFGIKRFGDIKVGDALFDRNGEVCYVTGETEVHKPESYSITFDRNKKVYASDKHLWFSVDKNERVRIARSKKTDIMYKERILTTKEMIKTLKCRGESNHSISLADAINSYDTKPLIDMYFLGYWLGNGNKNCGRVHCHTKDSEELVGIFKSRGLKCSSIKKEKAENGSRFNVYEQKVKLDSLGISKNKHIPGWVFSCSFIDRMDIIRGLLDSDGHISNNNNKGRIEFTSVDESVVKSIVALVSSCGFKCNYGKFKLVSNFSTKNTHYYKMSFTPVGDIDFFMLKRKKDRQARNNRSFTQNKMFYITNIEKVFDREMKCIEVDSPDNSFLITRNFIPTHNSTMASQAALYEVCCDNPNGNRIYCAATSRDQAKEVLNGSQIMARKNDSFKKNFGVDVRAHEILHPMSNSYIKAISAQANSLDGKIGQLVITDELHAMQRKTFEVLDSGMSKRNDSLLLSITTAGYENSGVGASQRKYAQKVALGEIEDETFFSMVWCLDEDEHDIWDEENWIMANPNWGVSVDPDNFGAKAKKAKANPEDQANFKIKHLNIYLGSLNQFFDVKKWKDGKQEGLKLSDFIGKPCYIGMDLSTKIDISSVCLVFFENEEYYFFFKNYIPEARLEVVKNRNYFKYIEEGDLTITPGNVINMDLIEQDIIGFSKQFRINDLLFDPWSATQMATRLSALRIEVTEFRMNTGNLSEPTKKMQEIMQDKKCKHNTGEMMEWCVGNVVCKYDAVGNVFPRKEHEDMKIDPMISAIMGLAGWVNDEQSGSVYDTRGMVFI